MPDGSWRARLRRWASVCRRELRVLLLVLRHPRTPWYARWWLFLVLAYALSPLDLIPDFIPVLGVLDDLLLLPLGIWLGLQLVPVGVREECRHAAEQQPGDDDGLAWMRGAGVALAVGGWLLLAGALLLLLREYLRHRAGV